jgi:hypothetical protein
LLRIRAKLDQQHAAIRDLQQQAKQIRMRRIWAGIVGGCIGSLIVFAVKYLLR